MKGKDRNNPAHTSAPGALGHAMTFSEIARSNPFFHGGMGVAPGVPISSEVSQIDELRARFDIVVGLNACQTAEKGTSMVICGLGGCIGGYIDNPHTNSFLHYYPIEIAEIDLQVRQNVSDSTNKVHFFVPGEWQKGPDGRYKMRPKVTYNEMLGPALVHIASMNVACALHCYDVPVGGNGLARDRGTAWIDRQGKLFFEGIPIQESGSRPATMAQPAKFLGQQPS